MLWFLNDLYCGTRAEMFPTEVKILPEHAGLLYHNYINYTAGPFVHAIFSPCGKNSLDQAGQAGKIFIACTAIVYES